MTDGPDGAAPPTPWYRRRGVLVTAVVAVVAVATVLVDLPVHASRASDISSETSVMSEVNSDLAPCGLAVHEAFTIWGDQESNSLTPSERGASGGLLRDDQAACSFTNESIYDLSNVEVPGSPAGKDIGDLVSTVTLWSTSDALSAIEDIQSLMTNADNDRARGELVNAERLLAADRRTAFDQIGEADHLLDTRLPAPDLPALPVPRGS
ncbi:MAG: hypothetical protein ACLPVF_20470 [Acidimicrobiales bacterium]